MNKNSNDLKNKQKEILKVKDKCEYHNEDELEDLEYFEIEMDNYETYELLEKNKEETGWFYPDDDEETEYDDDDE